MPIRIDWRRSPLLVLHVGGVDEGAPCAHFCGSQRQFFSSFSDEIWCPGARRPHLLLRDVSTSITSFARPLHL